VALGNAAQVGPNATNSAAIGAGSIANDPNTVSFGAPGAERRLTNVAAGIFGTDAVNLNQLNAAVGNLRAGIAAAMAQNAVPLALKVGEQGFTGAIGTFEGREGLGFHYMAQPSERVTIGVGIGIGFGPNNTEVGATAGVGYKW